MIPRPPRSTRTATPVPYTTLFLAPDGGDAHYGRTQSGAPASGVARQPCPGNVAASRNGLGISRPGSGPSGRRSPVFGDRDDFQSSARGGTAQRSEEHTYELQSLMRISYAVFCLKKKKKYNTD